MAVTVQNSVQITNEIATPVVKSETTTKTGKLRFAFFTHDQVGAGDANSTVALVKLPAGRVRLIGGLSRMYVNWTQGSQTMDIGWDAYVDQNGADVAADVDGLVDGLDVDSVGYFSMESNVAAGKLLGGTHLFDSRDGVTIRALAISAMVAGDDLDGYIAYVVD
tara:strand:- start:1048 stop:1539 length:492 start_codon:yes stop_codon:yes gene_type:complete